MLCYDAFVAPLSPALLGCLPAAPAPSAGPSHGTAGGGALGQKGPPRRHGYPPGRQGSATPASGATSGSGVQRALGLKLLRMATAAAAVLVYVQGRSALAGDQLVRIYRRVENPIPFAESSLTRKLTTGYLHARYAGLLLAPVQLSADWSYACIGYVSALGDLRNLATAALYTCLLATVLAARPWQVPQLWLAAWRRRRRPGRGAQRRPGSYSSGSSGREGTGPRSTSPFLSSREAEADAQLLVPTPPGLHHWRWRLAVLLGLVVGPFFPASNVLFYVGTFIGERLLYFPSLGFCLLAAEPLAAWLQPGMEWRAGRRSPAQCSGASERAGSSAGQPASPALLARAVGAALLLAAVLGLFSAKTLLRNLDWRDEEQLFRAAARVCGRSAKVQLNTGILERRYQRWGAAEVHFRTAQEIDPTYCEPTYHIGLTLVSSQQR